MLTVKDAIIKFASKASNTFASSSYPKGSVASMNFVVTSKGNVSYASFEEGGKIGKENSVHLSSGSTVQIINKINISEFSLGVLDSWRSGKIIPKTEILKSIGLRTEFHSGTVASIFGTFVHELTHVANFHVYTDSFKKLVNMYLDNRVAAYSIVSESFADQSLALSLLSRFEKSPEVFYLYPYNDFVRGWAETEAGAAGYVGSYVFGLFYVKALATLIKNLSKVYSFRYSQLTQGGLEKENILESINPIALMFKRIFYNMVYNNVSEESLIEKIIDDFISYREKLADIIYSLIYSDKQELEQGDFGFNLIREELANIFVNRYGFDRAIKISFAVDEGNNLYDDFVELVLTSVASDFVYYIVSILSYDYRDEIIQALKKVKLEIDENIGKGKKEEVLEQAKNKVLGLFFNMFAIASYYNLRDLSGDILLSSDYIIAWVSRMRDYVDRIMNSAANLDDLWSVILKRDYNNSEFDIIKNSVFTENDKTNSYNHIVNALKAIYKTFGTPEEYVDACLNLNSLQKFEATLDLPASLFVAINTFTEVYPITGSEDSINNLINAASSYSYNVRSDFYGYKFAKNNSINLIASKYKNKIKYSGEMRYTTGIFLLIHYLCSEASNWAYKMLYDSKLAPDDINMFFEEINSLNYMSATLAKQFYDNLVSYCAHYFNAYKSIRNIYVNGVKKTITSISSSSMTKNVSAFDRLLDYIFPANFSDILPLYKSVGAQMRIIEFSNELVNMIFNDSELVNLVKKKKEILEKNNREKTKEFEKNKKTIEEIQRSIDSIIYEIVKNFVKNISSKELWDFMNEKYGELDSEQSEDENKKPEEEKKFEPMPRELLIDGILRLIHSNSSISKIISFINSASSENWKDVYEKTKQENPLPKSKDEFKDAYGRAKELINGLRLIPAQSEVLDALSRKDYEYIENRRKEIESKSKDLVQVFDMIVNSVQLSTK